MFLRGETILCVFFERQDSNSTGTHHLLLNRNTCNLVQQGYMCGPCFLYFSEGLLDLEDILNFAQLI